MQPIYNPDVVRPMWKELEEIGIHPLTTASAVDEAMANKSGTVMIVVNSICGCAAGNARPGVAVALQNKVIPDRLYTVFAGVDRDATAKAREYIVGMPSSSPSIALFHDGELVYMLHRKQIEMMDIDSVAHNLVEAFDKYCSTPGPSVPVDVMARAFNMLMG